MIFDAVEINDEEGNGNHVPDYNESCSLGINLHNVGYSFMNDFNVTLSCDHPAVEIIQNTSSYHSMNADETQIQNSAFTVHFGDELYDQEKVKFYLFMENADYSFIDSVMLTIKAPDLKIVGLSFTDLDGTSTDRLMKGQSSYLTFDIENQGESKSMAISNKLKVLAPFLSIEDDEFIIPAIDAGATKQAAFLAHVDDDAVEGIINYSLQAESGFHNDKLESQIPLGYTTEDFEDESLNEDVQWLLGSGNRVWFIIEDSTALGGHILRSPAINTGSSCERHKPKAAPNSNSL